MAKKKFISDFFRFRNVPTNDAYQDSLQCIYNLAQKFIRYRLSDNQDQEEIIQEVVLAVHKGRFMVESEEKFLGFLYAIMRYKIIDNIRKKKRHLQTFINIAEDEDFLNFVAVSADESEINLIISDIDSILSAKEKIVFSLAKIQGKSNDVISSELNISVNAIKSILYRTKKKLKEYFQ